MPKREIFTPKQIAGAVFASDDYAGNLGVEKLNDIVTLALKNVIGQNVFLRGKSVPIDLGNGRILRCTLEPI